MLPLPLPRLRSSVRTRLILGGFLVLMGFIAFLFAILADLVNFNRRLVETTLRKVRQLSCH